MPDKPLTVATYAAGASLAAITLVYVFAPTYLLDGDSSSSRKKGIVGLSNPANDCFINSVLQALAGLTDLRVYLIRETHRRNIDEPWVYEEIALGPADKKNPPEWKTQGLQAGIVTKGLKDILDALNERPIYKKTISATGFVKVLETAFRQRISRQQQDAQELLQVVAERLCDEYHAGRRARQAAKRKGGVASAVDGVDGTVVGERLAGLAINGESSKDNAEPDMSIPRTKADDSSPEDEEEEEEEDGFPLEGRFENQIECQKCGFKPKPTRSTFCTLTLNVPQSSSTSLNTCLDGFFKTEYVDDYKCEKCRLVHARDLLVQEMTRSNSESFKAKTRESIEKLQHAIDHDPEKAPPDVELPDTRYAPKCRIAKHTRLISFPKIMSIHLSRSIYDASHMSLKNSAKVAFPEELSMGGLLKQKKYKLLGTVTHKGSHHSGHYESFRRQNIAIPFSTPNAFQPSGVFTRSAVPSPAATPRVGAVSQSGDPSPVASTPDLISTFSAASASNRSTDTLPRASLDTSTSNPNGRSPSHRASPTSAPREYRDRDPEAISLRSVAASARSTMSRISHSARNSRPGSPAKKSTGTATATATVSHSKDSTLSATPSSKSSSLRRRGKQQQERWWRISDEKIKDAKTSEVLGMQREVYLLFYELAERDGIGGEAANQQQQQQQSSSSASSS
ncbi:hypothetical protein F4778DRAFT_773934 [Xylariomycetidae sp. FL2044]|nr:hypothetical protein F4778DRAFT_773934 [Xylariomycetidae sp. FL2044]